MGAREPPAQPGGFEGATTIVRIVEGRKDPIDKKRPPRERRLRDRIADSPSLLPGVDKRPTAVSTEVRISKAGKADVVVVDAEGEITIVECKLAKNPQMRRWVIGQLFEYAAALWKLDIEDLERGLATGGTASLKPFKDTTRWQERAFRNTVSDNLANGVFRLIIAVDEITERLKRTVVFINRLAPPEVRFLALELPRGGEKEVKPEPVFYGDNSEEIDPLTPTWRPDRKSLLDGIRVRSADAARAAEGLLDWAEREQQVTVDYRRRKRDGPETGAIEVPDRGRLFRITEQQEVRVSLTTLRQHWGKERISQLVQELAEINERFQIDTKYKSHRPEAPLESLAPEDKREEFLRLMERVLKTVGG